jgi:hypothetical protein
MNYYASSSGRIWTVCPFCHAPIQSLLSAIINGETISFSLVERTLSQRLENHLCNECTDGVFALHLVQYEGDLITVVIGRNEVIIEIKNNKDGAVVTELTSEQLAHRRANCFSEIKLKETK